MGSPAGRRGAIRDHGACLRQPPRGPGNLFFCVPGFTRDGHELRGRRGRARGGGAGGRAAARTGRPGDRRRVGARGDGAGRRPLPRRSDGRARRRRDHRHERQDDDRVPRARAAGGGGAAVRPARHGHVVRRRGRAAGRADHRRGDRPAARLPRDARRRRRRVRDGGLLACAETRPDRRDPLRRGGLHEPDAGPPRLPPDDGGLLPREAAAVRGAGRRSRSSTWTTRTAGGWRTSWPEAITFAIDRDATLPRGRPRERLRAARASPR